jgi:hypothetical protein
VLATQANQSSALPQNCVGSGDAPCMSITGNVLVTGMYDVELDGVIPARDRSYGTVARQQLHRMLRFIAACGCFPS